MMFRTLTGAITVLGLVSAGSTAWAGGVAGQSYLGIDYGVVSYEEAGVEEANPDVLGARFGVYFTDNLALETRVAIGTTADTVYAGGVPVDVEIDSLAGVYGVGHLPLSRYSSIYGLVGYSHGQVTASVPGYSVTDSESGLSFGFGADIGLNRATSLNVDYTQYLDGTDYDVSALSVGMTFKF